MEVLGREPATGHYRTMARHPEAEAIPGLVIVRPRGPLSFANVERVRTEILAAIEQAQPQPRVLLCDLEAVADVEITALEVMARFAGELRDRGVQPWLAAIVGDQRAMLDRFGTVPEVRIFTTIDEAVIAFTTTDGH